TFTVRNGVDLEAFPGRGAFRAAHEDAVRSWRRRLQTIDAPLILSVVGQVAPEKGIHTLAAASAILRERGCEHVVAVAGYVARSGYARPRRARHAAWREVALLTKDYPERINRAARSSRFVLLGKQRPDDVRALLAAADVFAQPSLMPEPC